MSEPKTIIVMGMGKAEELDIAIRMALKKEHGEDLIILSASEAQEKGILNGNVPSISQLKFEAPKPFDLKPFELKNIDFDPYKQKNDCKKGWKK